MPTQAHSWSARLAIPVEMVIDLARHSLGNAIDSFQVGQAGARHRPRGAEMQQQRLFATGADAWYFVERRAQPRLAAPRAVGADGKAVGLVAQALQEIER